MGIVLQFARNSACLMLAVCAAFFGTRSIALSQGEAKPVLRGMVVDHTGAVVPNIAVEVFSRTSGSSSLQRKNQPATITLHTDHEGQFSAILPPGSYELCVPRFSGSCRTIELSALVTPEYLALRISPADEVWDPTLPESRFQKTAGPSARNCGRVLLDKDPARATACAMRAFKHREPFYVIYDEHCIDCLSARGMAWNSKGEPYYVSFDSMGLSADPALPSSSMPDGSHTQVIRCSQPVRVYINETGELDCFKERELWEQRIERGSREALLSAGETGYRELIPALKKRLQDAESFDDEDEKTATKMAMARLGDREQLQELLCRLHGNTPQEMQMAALDQIPYVGGWYAIRIYRELLMPAAEARFEKAKSRQDGDAAVSVPRWWALSSLPKVVPDGLPPGIDYGFNLAQMQEYSQKWLVWLQENEEKWKKLQPTGAGVDFSARSCKR